MNVDVKGDSAAARTLCKTIDVEKVWAASALARRRGAHIEITTLVIPTVNDSPATLGGIARRIATESGPEVPWDVTAYSPAYRFSVPSTPLRTLEGARQIRKEAGLELVYLGNVAGHRYEDTYCPACGARLIYRAGFDVIENRLRAGRCFRCGRQIAGVW